MIQEDLVFFKFIKNSKDLKKRFNHLGPEPFDKNFNLNMLNNFFKNKKRYKKFFT